MKLEPIAFVSSPFKEKFGIPRQPGLAPHARGTIDFPNTPEFSQAIEGIEASSHLWIVFGFHGNPAGKWSPLVRPPRLGGNKSTGVFATRSPFRPNPIGLSVVQLDGILHTEQHIQLSISCHDLLDQTPVYDIKPYIPYADIIPEATHSWTHQNWPLLDVRFAPEVEQVLSQDLPLKQLIIEMLQQDPRPAYKKNKADPKTYGIKLASWDVRFQVFDDHCLVIQLHPTE